MTGADALGVALLQAIRASPLSNSGLWLAS